MLAKTPQSTPRFKRLTSEAQLDRVLDVSRDRPIVLFKHSTTCGVSAAAYEQVAGAVDPHAGDWYVVDVRANRPVSNAITKRLGVAHESPQLLVVGDARVRWHGSHYQVTASAIRAAVQNATACLVSSLDRERDMQPRVARKRSTKVGAALALTVALVPLHRPALAQQAPQGVVPTVRAAIAKQDFKGGEQIIADYRKAQGITPEMVEAVSWLGRGALAAKQFDQATGYANQTYDLVRGLLKTRGLDDEPRLPIALGAAIEVIGQSRAATGARSDAVAYLRRELKTYSKTSMTKRIQKNINLLSLEGTKAPTLDLSESLGAKPYSLDSVKGKVAIVFFWAHWCPDCKNQGPALANLLKKYEAQGLTVIAPTQRYGYVAKGKEAGRDEERSYITEIKHAQYAFLDDRAVTLAETNHQRYGVSTTPTLVVLDRAGLVRSYHPGQMTEAELDTLVQKLVTERTAGTR